MWLFAQYGFYSVVCARDLAGNPARVDPDAFMVRARCLGRRGHRCGWPGVGVTVREDRLQDGRPARIQRGRHASQ
jgi:hypothetical protein